MASTSQPLLVLRDQRASAFNPGNQTDAFELIILVGCGHRLLDAWQSANLGMTEVDTG
jgi:hypothetical protein